MPSHREPFTYMRLRLSVLYHWFLLYAISLQSWGHFTLQITDQVQISAQTDSHEIFQEKAMLKEGPKCPKYWKTQGAKTIFFFCFRWIQYWKSGTKRGKCSEEMKIMSLTVRHRKDGWSHRGKKRTRKSFRDFSPTYPLSSGPNRVLEPGFVLFCNKGMKIFSHLHSLYRTLGLLEDMDDCSLDKEKQVYMCVRHMRKICSFLLQVLLPSPIPSHIPRPTAIAWSMIRWMAA